MTQRKTLDEILNRSDYSNLTPALKKRCEEIAKSIRIKMTELDIEDEELTQDFVKNDKKCRVYIRICVRNSRGNGSYEYLAINAENGWYSLEDIRHSFYYANDYSAWIQGATCNDAIKFLNVAREFILQLDEIESIKTNEIKQVLDKCKD